MDRSWLGHGILSMLMFLLLSYRDVLLKISHSDSVFQNDKT